MNRRTLATIVIGCCLTVAAASAEMNWPRIAQAIDLNREQVHQLRDAESRMLGGLQRIETAFEAGDIDRERAGEVVRRVRADFDQAWQEIVTDEQQERWRQLQQSADRDTKPRPDIPLWRRIATVVDLTRAQVGELEAAESAFHQRVHRLENAARDGGFTRQKAHDHLVTARSELNQAIVKILSQRQLHRIRESQVYDGNIGDDEVVATMLQTLDADPEDPTAVSALSWGQVKSVVRH
jgi:hypothetical protein